MRRRRYWHDPEDLPGQVARDEDIGRRNFHVYVLDTDYGHYIGHSGNLRARLAAHRRNEVQSTAGGSPQLIWHSRPLPTQNEAVSKRR